MRAQRSRATASVHAREASKRRRFARAFAVAVVALAALSARAQSATLPQGFQETVVISGRTQPTAVRFASNGDVFVAEKSGLVWLYEGVSDTSPVRVIDLRAEVHNYWDRGLLGLALDPNYPATPYLYVLYALDVDADGNGPRWGTGGANPSTSDPCPDPPDGPGGTADGCVVYGRLSRVILNVATMTGTEDPLLEGGWCLQYPSHSLGDLVFGEDGYLYVSSGEGASFNFADWGQDGSPINPCDDPPDGIGGPNSGTDAEGGSFRSQDILTPFDPASFDGSVLRLDVSGPLPVAPFDNPLVGNGIPDDDFIVAVGLRNPFRINKRPGTGEIWITDVGRGNWEELNRITDPTGAVKNFGWPCYEGNNTGNAVLNPFAGFDLCQMIYNQTNPGGTVKVAPYYAYQHSTKVVPNEACPSGGSSITGVTFNTGDNYPIQYANALFFADATRQCVWTMFANASGNPDKTNRAPLVTNATGRVVDIQMGLDGNLYYVDFDGGRIFRVAYFSANQPPTAVISAQPSTGAAPLLVQFNGGSSSDPENGALTYGWDLDYDGQFDDSSIVNPTFQYDEPGQHVARLRVVDPQGSFDTASKTITVNNTPPTATIAAPTSSLHWIVGQVINFSGGATDAEDGTLSASHLSWTLIMHHCAVPLDCHTHPITTINGVASGNFTAPDHDYPSFIEIKLTATDDGPSPLSDSVSVFIDPQAVDVTLDSSPRGLDLDIGEDDGLTPFTVQVIVGSNTPVAATSPQQLGETSYTYSSWSDGKAATHNFIAPAAPLTLTATFSGGTGCQLANPPGCNDGNACNGVETCNLTTGSCVAGTALVCNDGNACTTDSCVPASGCMFTNNSNACTDGNACTTGDICSSGTCVGTPVVCNDGNACNGVETCNLANGSCVAGTPAVCNDGNVCTTDSCVPASGCTFTNNTNACSDGNACTTGDTCSGGACVGTSIVCNDGVTCTTDTCSQGTCVATDNCPGGSSCNTQTGQCQAITNMVCVAAGKAPPATFFGKMTSSTQFAGGNDLDPVLDSLMPTLLFANSTNASVSGGSGDEARYVITIPQTATWYGWGRFYYPGAPGSNNANSFFLSIDGGPRKNFGNDAAYFQTFYWDGEGSAPTGSIDAVFLGTLAAGSHTLVIEKREVKPAGLQPRLDVVCLTKTATPPTDQAASALLASGCTSAANCDDGDACTTDACNSGQCTHSPKDCGDGNACTQDTCNPADGVCGHPAVSCNDSNACTTDTCDAVTGCAHAAVTCNDANACTTDSCNAQSGCVYTPVNCSDGNACTQDTCNPADGTCGHPAVNCNDGNACTTDTCDALTGCGHVSVNCNDSNACTADTCDTVTGCAHAAVSCDDANACTTDTCDAVTGCGHAAVNCNDANACTTDTCSAATGCGHVAINCNDSNACTTDTCDAVTGCAHAAASCNDNNVCTTDTCDAVTGCGHAAVNCSDANACTTDTCNAVTGCGHVSVNCNDQNACTLDTCSAQTGCANTAVTCPVGQTCSPSTGTCQSGTAPTLLCRRAGAPNQLLGAMLADTQFTGGADADASLNSLGTTMLFANSTTTAKTGGSGDEARYTIDFPTSGQWYVWGRFYYPGVPGSNDPNSFLVKLDAGSRLSFGNNLGLFQKFHWDANGVTETGGIDALSLGTAITAGSHTITVEKREVAAGKQPRLDILCVSKSSTPPTDAQATAALLP